MASAGKIQSLVLGGYLVVTILMTWPVVLHLSYSVAGSGGDPWQTMWRFENQESRIMNLDFWVEFFGGGEAALVNYSTLPWMPLHLLLGQPLAYNIVWLLSFVLSGYFMYLLVKYLVSSSSYGAKLNTKDEIRNTNLAAWLSGLVYMFLPYHVAHAQGHFGAMQIQWLPLAVLLLMRYVNRPQMRTVLPLVGVVAIQAWVEHHYLVWYAIWAAIYLLFEAGTLRRHFMGRRPWFSLGAGVLALILLVWLPYLPTARLALMPSSPLQLGPEQTIRFSADLFSYVAPASFHTLWGEAVQALVRGRFTGNVAESTHFVGWSVILLIIFFGQRLPRRQFRLWVTVAVIFWVISLGPRLHLLGRVWPVPLPYALFDEWPVVGAIRAVGRAGVMVGLALTVLFGWVAATQIRRTWVAGLVAGVLMFEFLFVPVPLQSTKLSRAYDKIGQLPGRAIIELPAATNYTLSSRALYASARHGKEVVGSIALERAEGSGALLETRSLPALRHLLYLRTGQLRRDRPDFFDQKLPETLSETLRWLDVGAILVHPDSLSSLQLAAVRNFLEEDMNLTAELFDDALLYAVPETIGQAGDGVFLARDGRWQNVGFDEQHSHTYAEISREAGITLYNGTAETKSVRLIFSIAENSHGNMLFVLPNEARQLTLAAGEAGEIELDLPPRSATSYVFRNQLTDSIIIQDPSLQLTTNN